ncbi:hypothetical protein JKL49_11415 [Phenylobacterium sp. 20VBR1]|uniref:Uncharacterized protein n=1 Tax=Phenylobacterium glaciei TaxID=2803784 RepID=A0A941HX65_9CAUL|nr:hypothetical protein [Phenylobacterium glaciei]MBR7619997.1 hypothetical protein [Phenylobacterium glaciei]
MSNDLGGIARFAKEHGLKFLGGSGVAGVAIFLVKQLFNRLRPDQKAYVAVVADLDQAADALDGIVGRPASLEADCERCRAVYKHRRRAGEGILEMFAGESFRPFRGKLTAIDRELGVLEDALHGQPQPPTPVLRASCERAKDSIAEVRRYFNRSCDKRLSIRVHGRRPSG